MQHGAADSWDAAAGDVGSDDEFNAPTYARDDSGVTWKKLDVEDKPPEWNGDDPITQAEPYINLLRMWVKTTSHEKNKQAKMVVDRMKGKLKGLVVEMLELGEDKTYPIFEEDALEKIVKELEKEYKDYHAMATIPFFAKYRSWKTFQVWKKVVKRGKIRAASKIIKATLNKNHF